MLCFLVTFYYPKQNGQMVFYTLRSTEFTHDMGLMTFLTLLECLHKYEFPTYPVQLHFLVNCAQTHFEMRYSSGDVLNLFAAEVPQLFHQVHSQKQHF